MSCLLKIVLAVNMVVQKVTIHIVTRDILRILSLHHYLIELMI